MPESVKINLTKIGIALVIIMTLSSVVGAGYIAYDNSKSTKLDLKEFKQSQEQRNRESDIRVSALEKKQARFEGRMDERTAITLTRVDDIYDIVKEWEKE